MELSEGQRAAVLRASTAPAVVLTGGPGCGKTFTTRAIVELWRSLGKDLRLAAPTGARARSPCCRMHACVDACASSIAWPQPFSCMRVCWVPARASLHAP